MGSHVTVRTGLLIAGKSLFKFEADLAAFVVRFWFIFIRRCSRFVQLLLSFWLEVAFGLRFGKEVRNIIGVQNGVSLPAKSFFV